MPKWGMRCICAVNPRPRPNDQQLFFFQGELAISHLMLGSFTQALVHAEAALVRRPAYWFAHVMRINALVRMGQSVEASHALAELCQPAQKFRTEMIDWIPFIDRHWNDFLKEGLNLAASRTD
jgi:hypothetical protein